MGCMPEKGPRRLRLSTSKTTMHRWDACDRRLTSCRFLRVTCLSSRKRSIRLHVRKSVSGMSLNFKCTSTNQSTRMARIFSLMSDCEEGHQGYQRAACIHRTGQFCINTTTTESEQLAARTKLRCMQRIDSCEACSVLQPSPANGPPLQHQAIWHRPVIKHPTACSTTSLTAA